MECRKGGVGGVWGWGEVEEVGKGEGGRRCGVRAR